ncbi:MAG: hypothetical protein ACYDA5_04830 [Vulcanimicrobiaceae bacterium]
MKRHRFGALPVIGALLACALGAGAPTPLRITARLLDFQQGFVFTTSGDGFRVSPHLRILDAKTGKPTAEQPAPRLYARLTFDPKGVVTELDLSRTKLPPEGNPTEVQQFAVALSPSYPNPELAPPKAVNGFTPVYTGKKVLVVFTVRVPPTTPLTATVYMTTDQSGWNPQAIPMNRVDALHFQVSRVLRSGTKLRYLYDRGSIQSIEYGRNGMQRPPRRLLVSNADVRAVRNVVYNWADSSPTGQLLQPNAIPTPYNPAPFPNLPPSPPPPR